MWNAELHNCQLADYCFQAIWHMIEVFICSRFEANFFCNLLVVIILSSTSQISFTPGIRSQSSFKIFRLVEQEKQARTLGAITSKQLAGWLDEKSHSMSGGELAS